VYFKDGSSGSVRGGERSEGDEGALRPQPVVLSLCCGLRGRSYWSGGVGRGGEARGVACSTSYTSRTPCQPLAPRILRAGAIHPLPSNQHVNGHS
jgi:hypothetical protein